MLLKKATRCKCLILALAFLSLLVGAPGQTAMPGTVGVVTTLPPFEIISVKPSRPGGAGGSVRLLPDGVRYSDARLQLVLRQAFGVQDEQIVDAPRWVDSDGFDIEARTEPAAAARLKGLTPDQR